MRKKLPNNKHKGLYLYCNKCFKYFSYTNATVKEKNTGKTIKKEPICGESEKKLSKCKFSDKHRYKSRLHYPNYNSKFKSRTLKAKNYNEAVIEAINFEKEFKSELETHYGDETSTIFFLQNAQIEYLDFINDIDVPAHKIKNLSNYHKKDIFKCLQYFNQALKKNSVNPKTILLSQINDYHVGYFHDYLLNHVEAIKSNSTYNNKIERVKSFFIWALDNYEINIKNPFKGVNKRTTSLKKDSITREEFNRLLEIISPEKGKVIIGNSKTRKNWYKPYLKDGIELVLHTGGRREEVVNMKWNMIKEVNNRATYIEVPNLKVERIKGEGYNDNVAPKIIPVTKSLFKILLRLGYNENKGSHEYILVPDRSKTSTNAIKDNLSKGFSHFYKLLDTGHELQMKCLRKTYLTYLNIAIGDDTKKLSSHANNEVLQKHYIDDKVISKAILDFEIFET